MEQNSLWPLAIRDATCWKKSLQLGNWVWQFPQSRKKLTVHVDIHGGLYGSAEVGIGGLASQASS